MARIYVGLSGGVDSAVSAALLREAGHEVTGCFIRIWRPEFLECTWREDRLDAMRVAAHLGIPFKELDLSEEYERHVIRDMVSTYERGETPNPDVLCNSRIKFDAFLSWALTHGADGIATGHYARIDHANARLLRGVDAAKDQSYFLWQLPRSTLEHIHCPVGHLRKSAVREEAARLSLPVAQKKDSQGLCFVGDITIPEFLSRYVTASPGPVVTLDGKEIGTHQGTSLYTIGQRHGLSLGGDAPYYVTRIDPRNNRITVSHDPRDAATLRASIRDTNWFSTAETSATYACAPRYHHPLLACTVSDIHDDSASVCFAEPAIAAPGQSLVIYDGDVLVGGGIIRTVDNAPRE